MARARRGPKSARQVRRALAQRGANRRAASRGQPVPFANPWDAIDPTKVPAGASLEEVHRSYLAFRALCPPRPRKTHSL